MGVESEAKRVAGTWQTILGSLSGSNKALPVELKVDLLAQAIKQFSINKPKPLAAESAKKLLQDLLDGCDSRDLMELLPKLNQHSGTATAVLIDYLLTQHEQSQEDNSNGGPATAGILSQRNLDQIAKIVEGMTRLPGRTNRLNVKLVAIQAKNRIVPNWANPAVLVSAALLRSTQPGRQAVQQAREAEVARIEQKISINKKSASTLADFMNRQGNQSPGESQA